jgi:hypothetical protein
LFFWGKFFGWGNYQLDYHDWGFTNIPRILAVQEALQTGTLPFHMTVKMDGVTDRYFATADVITTPEMLLLLFIPVNQYCLFQMFIFFSISTLGFLWLRSHYKVSLFSYSILFILFNFSGYIQSHLEVGHFIWGPYFLLPLLMVLVVQFLEHKLSWRWIASISFLFLYMVLAGGYHIYVWCLIFLTLLGITCYDRAKWMLGGLLGSLVLSMLRLLPPALEFSAFKTIHPFLGGYPSLSRMWLSMATILQPGGWGQWAFPNIQGTWEYDLFVGFLGSLILVYFGIIQWFKNHARIPELNKLALPSLALLILSVGNTYSYLERIPIPFWKAKNVLPALLSCLFWWS